MHGIILWIVGALILGVSSLIINLILLVLKIGNLKSALFDRKVVALLKQLPGETLLACQSKKVSALVFDRARAQEQSVYLYSGDLTWHGPPRQATKVLNDAKR